MTFLLRFSAPVFFQLQLPSPPSSPDEEQNELTNYLQQFASQTTGIVL